MPVASGQSTSAWCAEHDIKLPQLRYWLRKFKSVDTTKVVPTQWLPVEIDKLGPNGQGCGLVVRVGHAVTEIQPGFTPAILREVVRTLKEL
ncbi:helix-turn-helix domain-containing protein [Bacillota bacterium LX-D]|nr:helix-turn-helix domain-containing protein [Bacillota bacterium LX-D]